MKFSRLRVTEATARLMGSEGRERGSGPPFRTRTDALGAVEARSVET